MTKSELRAQFLSGRKAISPDDLAETSRLIAARFFERHDLDLITCLHCFLPIEKFNEIDTRLIIGKVWRDHPRVQLVVPRTDLKTGDMLSLKFGPDTVLGKNVWGIDEPTHNEFVEPESIDMVLVPGLCFDRDRHRVGYGKGYYDQFLKKCRPDCLKIGLSYFEPVEKIDDVHDGDVQLDFVITP
jgi:5-formyltetrahydrofolate cyclo-ligase